MTIPPLPPPPSDHPIRLPHVYTTDERAIIRARARWLRRRDTITSTAGEGYWLALSEFRSGRRYDRYYLFPGHRPVYLTPNGWVESALHGSH